MKSRAYGGPYRTLPQHALNFDGLIVDLFAGGGGASTGIEQALGRPVDVAINHDPDAIRMHEVNHPQTRHYCESVWEVDPREVCQGRAVDLLWASPDCKHFSKAKGGKPREKAIRGLAWSVLRWVATVRPRVVMLENVEEFKTWGPLLDNGQPCPKRKGRTFNAFVNAFKRHGYQVEWRELRACDYGAPTIRKRLFLVARCDGQPIAWPMPTHGAGRTPYRSAAECIDWSLPCPSIFTRKRPLAEATLRRIARGLQRFVIENPRPFIVPITHQGGARIHAIDEPLRTITTAQRGEFALCTPYLQTYYGEKRANDARGQVLGEPLRTQTTENRHGLVTAFLAKHYGGNYNGPGSALQTPAPTVTSSDHTALVTSHLVKLRNNQHSQSVHDPLPTVTAGGGHVGEVRAFLIKYYGEGGQWQGLSEPMHTIPTRDRIGLVTVHGEPYQIVDIGMRMLEPRELFRAQGFPDDYVITHDGHGKQFSKTAQVARCGNSVSPMNAAAIVAANFQPAQQQRGVA